MHKLVSLVTVLWAASCLAVPASAAPPQGENAEGKAIEAAPAEATSPELQAEMAAKRALGLQMATELAELFRANREAVAAVETRIAEAPADQHEALQAEIAALKAAIEIDRMELQARYARIAGNEELALEIEASVEKLRNPAPVAAPADVRVDRPVPSTESQ